MAEEEGENFRTIPGKKKNSKIYIHNNYCFLVDKSDKNVIYLKCKDPSCPARATVKNNSLTMSANTTKKHNCNQTDPQNASKIVVNEIFARMKERAANEGTSYLVSKTSAFKVSTISNVVRLDDEISAHLCIGLEEVIRNLTCSFIIMSFSVIS